MKRQGCGSETPREVSPEFSAVFAQLRAILERNIAKLTVTSDTPTHFCLTGGVHPKHKTPMPIAWVEVGKGYVSYHLMPIYGYPKLLDSFSPVLKKRMQGKSCFNFKTCDEKLFEELERLTVAGFAAFRKAGFMGGA
jgi:hypothetical protein